MTIIPIPPCLGCEERHAYCHGNCERYKAFRMKLDEYNKLKEEERRREGLITQYEIARWKKIK